jgi:N-acetylmuramoyl-L-alanine amidase CwlA
MGCSRRYRAAHDSGARRRPPRWIVVHATEGETAAGAASWLAKPAAGGSAHLVVDDEECYRLLPDDIVAWGAPGANGLGLHIELAGFSRWARADWLRHEPMLERASRLVAGWCRRYGIPARWVGPAGLLLLRRGITTHADVTRAFRLRFPWADHWDPGPGFPRDVFLSHVRQRLRP